MNYPYTSGGSSVRLYRAWCACFARVHVSQQEAFLFHTPAWAEALAARPGNQVRAFETGHWIMSKQPRELNDVVDAWLRAG